MFCDLYTPEGEVYTSDTRVILKRAIAAAEEAGIEFRFGNEIEFYLFKNDEEGRPTGIPYDEAGYMDIAPLDKCENIRRAVSPSLRPSTTQNVNRILRVFLSLRPVSIERART